MSRTPIPPYRALSGPYSDSLSVASESVLALSGHSSSLWAARHSAQSATTEPARGLTGLATASARWGATPPPTRLRRITSRPRSSRAIRASAALLNHHEGRIPIPTPSRTARMASANRRPSFMASIRAFFASSEALSHHVTRRASESGSFRFRLGDFGFEGALSALIAARERIGQNGPGPTVGPLCGSPPRQPERQPMNRNCSEG